nr:MAG TPA: hypothetical protein [Caudoviricetes sp.]
MLFKQVCRDYNQYSKLWIFIQDTLCTFNGSISFAYTSTIF